MEPEIAAVGSGWTSIEELHRLEPSRTALLVVDMQRVFVDAGAALEVPQAQEIIPHLKQVPH